jgi:hypothetical protein
MNCIATFGQFCCGLLMILLGIACELSGHTAHNLGTGVHRLSARFMKCGNWLMTAADVLFETALELDGKQDLN